MILKILDYFLNRNSLGCVFILTLSLTKHPSDYDHRVSYEFIESRFVFSWLVSKDLLEILDSVWDIEVKNDQLACVKHESGYLLIAMLVSLFSLFLALLFWFSTLSKLLFDLSSDFVASKSFTVKEMKVHLSELDELVHHSMCRLLISSVFTVGQKVSSEKSIDHGWLSTLLPSYDAEREALIF